jgi:hypothetical protein
MLATLLVFCASTYGLAYLVADAKIFGCPTASYVEDPTDTEYIRSVGVLPIRQLVLRFGFFRKQFQCYFCLGVPSGATIHGLFLLLAWADKTSPLLDSYFMLGRSTLGIIVSTLLAAILGCAVCGVTDLMVRVLENKVNAHGPAELETVAPPSVDEGDDGTT